MLELPLLFAAGANQLWYFVPLVVAVSLVWSATRHEEMGLIVVRAGRAAVVMFALFGLAFLLLFLISRWL